MSLAIICTHPVQYHMPFFKAVQTLGKFPVKVICGTDVGIATYMDKDFQQSFSWDVDLTLGMDLTFLSKTKSVSQFDPKKLKANGLSQALKQASPKVIMLTGNGIMFHIQAFFAALRYRCPIIFRAETTDVGRFKNNFIKEWLRERFLHFMYKRIDRMLFIGKYSKEHYLKRECPEDKLIFSPYCVNAKALDLSEDSRNKNRKMLRERYSISHDDIVLLFVGKLTKVKKPMMIFDAVQRLNKNMHQKLVIMFMGSGPLEATLKERANEMSTIRTFFVGFKNQKELSAFYHVSDILVLPSIHEPWGLVVNEAMHHGLPCVVSDKVCSGPDLVIPRETGEIFDAESPQAFSEAIIKVAEGLGHIYMRENCIKRVSEYGVEQAAKGVVKAYQSCL